MDALPADIPYRRLLAPAVLLFGDDGARRDGLAERVLQAGGRVVASEPVGNALARIERQAAGGFILDLAADTGATLDALLARVDALGEAAGRPFAVVIVSPALIDVAAARLGGSGTRLLVDPSEPDLAGAIAELTAAPSPWLLEEGGAASKRRLAERSEEVGRIARMLASMSAGDAERTAPVPRAVAAADGPLVRAFIRLRKLRGQYFLPELFADPAWDILLDLTAARLEGRMVAVSSLCIAAAVPATTALRWITQMTDQGLLMRKPDPSDGRRIFIGLSDQAVSGMDGYLAATRAVIAPVG